MPDRVYMNRRSGEERIHVELTRAEIREMLARPAGPEARAFWGLLATADHQLGGVTLVDPKHAEPGAGPRCVCGDPIERWTGPGEPGWIHSPGSDTACLDARPPAPRRQLTELEHDAAWHAIEGTAAEEGADPGTVLAAVLRALDIDPPTGSPAIAPPVPPRGCPAKHGDYGRVCRLAHGHRGPHSGQIVGGWVDWDGDASYAEGAGA